MKKNYQPDDIESYWYSEWERRGYFKSGQHVKTEKNPKSYVIYLPPPNITGSLHMGHAFNQTIIDILIRYQRMSGNNTVSIPGIDHAGIATQIIVERQLENENISRYKLGREKFLEKVWDWKKQSYDTITKQMRRLGISTDWSREYFTMDKRESRAVTKAFVHLYKQGLIYRGKRLVNWDPKLLTAVSDLEVQLEEVEGKLFYILYPFFNGPQTISDENQKSIIADGLVIATTRPETILGDSALCVHPDDIRYKNIIGKYVELPLCNRQIPIICDNFVDPKFGTGCVKITGAHDFEDYSCSIRHNLPIKTIFTLDAHINDNAPKRFRGLDRYIAREAILSELYAKKYLIKIQKHKITQPKGDRSDVILEPMLTNQWFINMNKSLSDKSLVDKALYVVEKKYINFFPKNWEKIYNQWLRNIQDWCISRQIWWGHQIPAWYSNDGQVIVAQNEDEAIKEANMIGINCNLLTRDQDVLDTWFSSALIPLVTLGWPDNTSDLKHYLPSNILVSGFDIIFFWIARMIIMSTHLTGQIPFENVYIHGLVRDAKGQKMSKSKGNTLDPIDLIDGISLDDLLNKRKSNLIDPKKSESIERDTRKQYPNGIPTFGTDALRITMASYASLGRNINFDLKRCEGYRNFCNKFWNAARFVLICSEGYVLKNQNNKDIELSFVDHWINSQLQELKHELECSFSKYRFDNIALALHHFIWNEYCNWYIEFAKIQMKNGSMAQKIGTCQTLIQVLEILLRLAHPIMPFITEELWQRVSIIAGIRSENSIDSISVQRYPNFNKNLINKLAVLNVQELKSQIDSIRNLRSEINVSPEKKILIFAQGNSEMLQRNLMYLVGLTQSSQINIVKSLPDTDDPVQIVGATRFMLKVDSNPLMEKNRLERQICQLKQKIDKIDNKLANEKFIQRAPVEIIEKEKNQHRELIIKLKVIKEQFNKINK